MHWKSRYEIRLVVVKSGYLNEAHAKMRWYRNILMAFFFFLDNSNCKNTIDEGQIMCFWSDTGYISSNEIRKV